MPRYRYIAVNPQGHSQQGEVDGANPIVARQALLESGLQVNDLRLVTESPGQLTAGEGVAVAQQVAAATRSELPLVAALRAYSEEVFSARVRTRLSQVCDSLEAGEPLGKILSNPGLRLPASVAGILSSGLPTSAVNVLLTQAMRSSTTTFELRARAFLLVSYTCLMLGAMSGLWLFLLLFVTPEFSDIFHDFGTELPVLTQQIVKFSNMMRSSYGLYLLVLLPIGVAVQQIVYWQLTPAARRRFWCGLPIVGSMYRLTALSEFANSLAAMLESEVPLPQAIAWSAAASNDADLKVCGDDVAARLRWGEDPITAGQSTRGLPAYVQQMLRWAAQGAAGAEPLRSMAKLLQIRSRSLSLIALPLLEPVLLTATVATIGIYVLAMFMPLIKLLNDLS